MKKRRKLFQKGMAWLLTAAMTVGMVFTDGLAMTAQADTGESMISEAHGYEEGAYITWSPVKDSEEKDADGYEVYVSSTDGEDSWEQLDDSLIRNYGTYLRADALGLTPGTWYFKVVAAKFNSYGEKIAGSEIASWQKEVTVSSLDRAGFAWVAGSDGHNTASGAYEESGALKADAQVIYVTEATKDKVSITYMESDSEVTVTGIQNIFNVYKQKKTTKPLDVRVIGTVTDPAVLTSGDLVLETGNAAPGITIEGVGEDAVIRGFGITLQNSSNVEIRNLGFMLCDSGEGDNVSLTRGNDHVWVHNCDFFYGEEGSDPEGDQKKGDGMLDCKLSNYVTFSYNHFWDSGKSCLLGLAGESDEYCITYHHNWFDHSDSRHPRIRYYSAHVYNNYYDGNAKYGVGATTGSSVFVESNYFRNCTYPMKISMQGSDNGTFSSEDGGMIKAYNNYMTGQKAFINGNQSVAGSERAGDKGTGDGMDKDVAVTCADTDETRSDFDAYVVTSRMERVPDAIVTRQGGTDYNNFDTEQDFYTYEITPVMEVPAVVKNNAGRLNGGDFQWDFTEADDTSSDVNTELKAALTSYASELVSVGGILTTSEKTYVTVSFVTGNSESIDPIQVELNQPISESEVQTLTVVPAGYEEFGYWMNGTEKWDFADPVTAAVCTAEGGQLKLTLTAKWYTEAEADANKRGGTPIGEETVKHSILERGLGSRYLEINATIKAEASYSSGVYAAGTADEWKIGNGRNGRITFDNTASVRFTTTTENSLLVVLMDKAKSSAIKVDGTTVSPADGVVMATIAAGDHILTNSSSCYVTGIMVVPNEKVPEVETEYEEDKNNISLNMADLPSDTDYSSDIVKNGFTIKPTVKAGSSNKSVDGVSYSSRIQLAKNGSTTSSCITFDTKGAAQLYVAAMSGNAGETRNIVFSKKTESGSSPLAGTVIVRGNNVADQNVSLDSGKVGLAGDKLYSVTVSLAEAGTYYVWAETAINVFAIKVTYPNIYTVKFDAQNGTDISSTKVSGGQKVTAPADPERANYTFGGWYTDAACTDGNQYDFTAAVTKSFTLYAKWTQNQVAPVTYTVRFYLHDGSDAYEEREVESAAALDERIAAYAPTRDGYIFKGWYTDPGCEENTKYIPGTALTGDINLYAKWVLDSSTPVDPGEEYDENAGEMTVEFLTVSEHGDVVAYESGKYVHVYVGRKITPVIQVKNGSAVLTENVDYTVKYSNNVNVSKPGKPAMVTVAGKGDYSGKKTLSFEILPKDLGEGYEEEIIRVGNTTVAEGTKAAPTLFYNGVKLASNKDYTLEGTTDKLVKVDEKAGKEAEEYTVSVTVKAKAGGNYTGEIKEIPITVVRKASLKKFKADLAQGIVKRFNHQELDLELSYQEGTKAVYREMTVYDADDKGKMPLTEGVDFEVSYTSRANAGTVKVTIVGIGKYTGTVTKTYKILPDTETVFTPAIAPESGRTDSKYSFKKTGVTPMITLEGSQNALTGEKIIPISGVDYKVSYTNNKKLSTDKAKAGYTITFLGNYKGHAPIRGSFEIVQADLADAKIQVSDMAFNAKTPKTAKYLQAPFVTLNGVLLAKNEYAVRYFDEAGNDLTQAQYKNALLGVDAAWPEKTIKVVITANPKNKNYFDSAASDAMRASATYEVRYVDNASGVKDMSKAKISYRVVANGTTTTRTTTKLSYTGAPVRFDYDDENRQADIVVTLDGQSYSGRELFDNFDVEYVNNVNKGKATVIVTAKQENTKYVGSKTGTFTIAASSFADWLRQIFA